MKKYIWTAIVIIITGLIAALSISVNQNNRYKDEISIYDNNFKALNLEVDSLKNKAIAYQFDIEQLEYINDSIINNLNATRRELNIKDKDIKQMQYILSEGNMVDTVVFKDTIFRNNFIKIDTTLGDDWCKIKLESLSPNSLYYNVSYTSELEVFAHSTKEIIGTPKKCFVARWFQRKHKVIKVDVVDNNPHAKIKKQKFLILD